MTNEVNKQDESEESLEVISFLNTDIHPVKKYKPIPAFIVVSESEVNKVVPNYNSKWPEENQEEFFKLLWEAGCDTNYEIEIQDNLKHRNRMNEVVICRRWICYERVDTEWINSGNASRDAIHKASGNKLLIDLNRFVHNPL